LIVILGVKLFYGLWVLAYNDNPNGRDEEKRCSPTQVGSVDRGLSCAVGCSPAQPLLCSLDDEKNSQPPVFSVLRLTSL